MEFGTAIGGTDKQVGQDIEDFNLCLVLVRQTEPSANGVTYGPTSKDCFAEFNSASIDFEACKTCQSCVFAGKGRTILKKTDFCLPNCFNNNLNFFSNKSSLILLLQLI